MEQYWARFIIVMCIVIVVDIGWAFYFIKVEERKAYAAGLWSSFIMLLGSFSISRYIEDRSLIIAAALGAFIGTTLSVLYKKRQEQKEKK